MDLKLLLLFGVCLGLVAYTKAVEGSGDDGSVVSDSTTTTITVNADTDSDLDQDASGDDEETSLVLANTAKVGLLEPVGSGDEEDNLPAQTNRNCTVVWCWCTYTDGTEIPNTKVYVQQLDCSRYTNMVAPVPAVPTRSPVTKAREEHIETQSVTEDDIIFLDETTTVAKINNNVPGQGSDSDIDIDTKTDEPIDIDNNVPSSVDISNPSKKDEIEKKEEETNQVYGTGYMKGDGEMVEKELVLVSHPGIMAALIGGGVVGLLCFILIILFIVYRVRKKDEGSYPLGDEKPLKNYAYSKAPSQEFYA